VPSLACASGSFLKALSHIPATTPARPSSAPHHFFSHNAPPRAQASAPTPKPPCNPGPIPHHDPMMIANQTDFQNSSTTTQPTPTQGGAASSRPSSPPPLPAGEVAEQSEGRRGSPHTQPPEQQGGAATNPTPSDVSGGAASRRPSTPAAPQETSPSPTPILPPTADESQLLGEILGSHLPLAIIASNFDTTVTAIAIAEWMATSEIKKRIALIERAALAATRVRSNRFLSTKNGCCGIHSVVLHVRGKFSFQ
jgi:hypothetical protein